MSTSHSTAPAVSTTEMNRLTSSLRMLALAAVVTAAGLLGMHRSLWLADNNIWLHLRTGSWILQNHAVPRSGLFSQSASLAWVDANWGFDVLVGLAYRWMGLRSFPALLLLLQGLAAALIFLLAYSATRRFWPAVLIAAAAQFCISPMPLRPGLCSLIFVATELALLFAYRRTGSPRFLVWLPLLFLVWASVDRQFSYGLLVIVLLCIGTCVQTVWGHADAAPRIHPRQLALAACASFAATFITPYGYRLHGMLWRSATSTVTDRYFRELHSMRFRQPQDYVLLLIVMAAFFALGRNRSRDVVIISLLAVSAVISFRLQRDSWFVVMVSVAILGSELRESQSSEEPSVAHLKGTALALALIIVVVVAGVATLPSNAVLSTQVAERYPLRACDYIRQNHLPQPLFNAYDWGAFATWCLPEDAVYIDSRTELYGDGFSVLYFKLMQAEIPIQSHPGFAQAQTFLLEANAPLAEALATLPGFHVSYRDSIATVIVRD